MAERVIELTAGELEAMAHRVSELEDYQHELLRDSQLHIDDLVAQLMDAQASAAKWRRYHNGARRGMYFAAICAAAGWITALVGWLR